MGVEQQNCRLAEAAPTFVQQALQLQVHTWPTLCQAGALAWDWEGSVRPTACFCTAAVSWLAGRQKHLVFLEVAVAEIPGPGSSLVCQGANMWHPFCWCGSVDHCRGWCGPGAGRRLPDSPDSWSGQSSWQADSSGSFSEKPSLPLLHQPFQRSCKVLNPCIKLFPS